MILEFLASLSQRCSDSVEERDLAPVIGRHRATVFCFRSTYFSLAIVLMTLNVNADTNVYFNPGIQANGTFDLGVPPLKEQVADADILGAGLKMDPIQPYQWVIDRGILFPVTIQCNMQGLSDRVVLTVWDWENNPVAQSTFPTSCSEKVNIHPDGRRGTYVLTLDGVAGSKSNVRLVRSFSACPSNAGKRAEWKKNKFWLGQCGFPGWQDGKLNGHTVAPPGFTADQSMALDADLVGRMGVQVSRINLSVVRRDDAGLDLDFSTSDKCVEKYVSLGMDLDLQIFMPYGAGVGPILKKYSTVPAEKAHLYPLEEYANRFFTNQVVSRYGSRANFFQIGNEPDNTQQYLGAPQEYVNTVTQSRDEILKLAPGAVITNGGYAFANSATAQIIGGLVGLTNFSSYHCHDKLPALKSYFSTINSAHVSAKYNNSAYANTEMGYGMATVGDEANSAQEEMQKILYCWSHQHLGAMLYSSRELYWPRQYKYINVGAPDYGFVDYFFCPRFSYGAVSAFIDSYAGAQFESVLKESDNFHAYVFRRGGDLIVAYFAVQANTLVKFYSDCDKFSIVDPMGNDVTVASGTSSPVEVLAKRYPMTMVLYSAANVSLDPLNFPPKVSIINPINNANVQMSDSITINATAIDAVGLTGVIFYIDGKAVNTDTVAPYSWVWNTSEYATGPHAIAAQAWDVGGLSQTASLTVNVTETTPPNIPPKVSITSPADNANVQRPDSTTINVAASDDTGLAGVVFYIDGKKVNKYTVAPYSWVWNTSEYAAGPHTIAAQAWDVGGLSRVASVTVNVTEVPVSTSQAESSTQPGSENTTTLTDSTPVAGPVDVRTLSPVSSGLVAGIRPALPDSQVISILTQLIDATQGLELTEAMVAFASSVHLGASRVLIDPTTNSIVTVSNVVSEETSQRRIAVNDALFPIVLGDIPVGHTLVAVLLPVSKESHAPKSTVGKIMSFSLKRDGGDTVTQGFNIKLCMLNVNKPGVSYKFFVQRPDGNFEDSGFPVERKESDLQVSLAHFSVYALIEDEARADGAKTETLTQNSGGSGGCFISY